MIVENSILQNISVNILGVCSKAENNSFRMDSDRLRNESLIAAIQCFIAHFKAVTIVQGGFIITYVCQFAAP